MAAPMTKTSTPGIYKRGGRYAVRFRDADGRLRYESARTLDDARRLKAKRSTQVTEGSYTEASRETFAEYSRKWVESHQGSRGNYRESTRDANRRDLERYAIPYFGTRRLTSIRRADVQAFVAHLVDDQAQEHRHEEEQKTRVAQGKRPLHRGWRPLKDGSVTRIHSVVNSVFSAAVLDGLRTDNPAQKVVRPRRDQAPMSVDSDDGDEQGKALTRAQLDMFLRVVPPTQRLFFRVMAGTGLRLSEMIALEVGHLDLDRPRPVLKVRRAFSIGKDGRREMQPPKSRAGRRDVPIPRTLVAELRSHIAHLPEQSPEDVKQYGRLLFPSEAGRPMNQANLISRKIKPAMEEAGAPWACSHALRHSFASMHLEAGTNILRLSKLLGHANASMTLDVYSWLLDDGPGEPLDLDTELSIGAAITQITTTTEGRTHV